MSQNKTDLTASPDLLRHAKGTGPLRKQRPIYQDFLPPCNHACPAGENIQAWLALAMAGQYEQAWQKLIEDNPMPAILGRVCYHPCEDSCNRTHMDEPVSIHAVERFLGDKALEAGWQPRFEAALSGKRVLVIGAGPSGLSAAYHLRRLGHEVEIRDAGPVAGGMMHFGIPAYRLPRNVLAAEAQQVEAIGVKMTFNHKVEDVLAEKAAGHFDAVFLAIGTHLSKKIDIPARDAGKILDALTFLKNANTDSAPQLGRRVAIYGGGNTAMDAARIAKRLGYEPLIIFRLDRTHMTAFDSEVNEALSEGVKINWLRSIKEIDQQSFKVEIMRVENGQPVGTGEYETLEADALVLALGQETDTSFLRNVPGITFDQDGMVKAGPDMMTGCPAIFAGGDMVPSERTVTIAIGHGKKAARFIDGYLRGRPYSSPPKHPIAGFERLHTWYQTFAPQQTQPELKAETRTYDFNEIVGGLNEEEARYEAQRCLSCGNCFECDGCYGACPEDAVIKLGPGKRYRFNYDLCTGCAVCFEQCPCHAIEMVAEPE
ncbi:NAD(P)-binding protein [Nitrosomonas sp. ANs5]|uniref:NAD(P)-binding protein n=1 Tax=Nitrosomonas sp. ANs5 TaxID=3423941 RepID=UPI003D325E2B